MTTAFPSRAGCRRALRRWPAGRRPRRGVSWSRCPPRPTDYERDAAGLEGAEFVTANCFCRRDALEAVGGFDERFSAAWREDSDLHFALLRAGRADRPVPNPPSWSTRSVRPPGASASASSARACSTPCSTRSIPTPIASGSAAARPGDYYVIVGTLAIAAAAAVMGRIPLALGAAGLWVVLTVRFCARRLRGTSASPRHVARDARYLGTHPAAVGLLAAVRGTQVSRRLRLMGKSMSLTTVTLTPPMPRFLQVEAVGQCNLRCQMCPIQFRQDGPPHGPPAFMEFALFERLLDQFPRPRAAANSGAWRADDAPTVLRHGRAGRRAGDPGQHQYQPHVSEPAPGRVVRHERAGRAARLDRRRDRRDL